VRQWLGGVVLGAVVGGLTAGGTVAFVAPSAGRAQAENGRFGVVQASVFELVDADGGLRGRWYTGTDGSAALSLRDAAGVDRAVVLVSQDDARMHLFDPLGQPVPLAAQPAPFTRPLALPVPMPVVVPAPVPAPLPAPIVVVQQSGSAVTPTRIPVVPTWTRVPTATATATPSVVDANRSSVSVQSTIASLTGGTILTVIARDAAAIPVVNATVSVTPARLGDVAVPMLPLTDPTGTATFQLRGGGPGTAIFFVRANGVALSPATVTFQ
jgi:hypothetical protein